MKLPDLLGRPIGVLPTVDEIPTYNTKIDASIDVLRSVREKFKILPSSGYQESLEEIVRPIVSEMRQLKPTLVRQMESYSPIKQSLVVSMISFIVSIGLHILFFYLYHRYSGVRNLMLHFLKIKNNDKKQIPLKPSMFYDSDKHGNIDVNDHDDRYILPINTFKDIMGSARKTDDQVRNQSSCSRMRSRSSSVFDIAERSLAASTNTSRLADINNAQTELNNELTL